jgi:ABC-type enterochelin transport system permease subunit
MSAPKVTKWISCEVLPVHPGRYECLYVAGDLCIIRLVEADK